MPLDLTLHTAPEVPLEAEAINPDRLTGLGEAAVAALPVQFGNRPAALADFFRVAGSCDGEVRVHGELARVKLIGAGMSRGRIVIDGDVGLHLGAAMTGGEIVGAGMSGGRITVKGDAGRLVGSAYRGSRIGMRGGEIVVHGRAGNEVGNAMRNGLIAIGGDCGDFAGVNMLAGTIVVMGRPGNRYGAGMKRGTIVAMRETSPLPTFTYACTTSAGFLRLYLLHLRALGLPVDDAQIDGRYRRWSGDAIELNRGELLILADQGGTP
jgi:formylmethanofuran dehydrogenase subunit C